MSVVLWGIVAAGVVVLFSRFLGGFCTLAIGAGGAPGQIVAERIGPSNGGGLWACFLGVIAGQLAVALTWAAFVVGSTANWLAAHPTDLAWLVWVTAFVAAAVPAHWAANDDATLEGTLQSDAAAYTAVLADLGFLALALLPAVRTTLFGWVPTLFG